MNLSVFLLGLLAAAAHDDPICADMECDRISLLQSGTHGASMAAIRKELERVKSVYEMRMQTVEEMQSRLADGLDTLVARLDQLEASQAKERKGSASKAEGNAATTLTTTFQFGSSTKRP